MKDMEALYRKYDRLMTQQDFNLPDLDYNVLDKHLPFLTQLSQVHNSGITIFDLYRREHLFTSYNFSEIFGYDLKAINEIGNEYFNSRVHPDDLNQLYRNGITIMHFYLETAPMERASYKFVNRYRVKGRDEAYIWVIEQHQALETDSRGNVWLALGVIDISPDQSYSKGVQSQVYNFRTGEILPWPTYEDATTPLSKREVEILQFVKDGLLSKEISQRLFISINTVNTHRQRILKKLGANNAQEAIVYASQLGLL